MSRHLIVHSTGPQVTVQDHGRPGFLAFGLSRGGAVDALALVEGATLLGPSTAALEMAGMGGEFETDADPRIALTGAPMRANSSYNAVWLQSTSSKGAANEAGNQARSTASGASPARRTRSSRTNSSSAASSRWAATTLSVTISSRNTSLV